MKYCFGVDIGGTTVKLGVFEEEGKILTSGKFLHIQKMKVQEFYRISQIPLKQKWKNMELLKKI